MNKPIKNGVPRVLYLIIIVLIASMYYYAAYIDHSNPEVVVKDFYVAYFHNDHENVAKNLSVFLGAQFMPQYMFMSPNELIDNRPVIEQEMADILSQIEPENTDFSNMTIKILPEYTQRAQNTALVAYEFEKNDQSAGLEMALLLKEADKMRIFKRIPVDQEQLDQLKNQDLSLMDKSFTEMLSNRL
ncbi:MAG: hypothetical protein ACOX6E_03775 [Syntrophomonadaceae bacterium]